RRLLCGILLPSLRMLFCLMDFRCTLLIGPNGRGKQWALLFTVAPKKMCLAAKAQRILLSTWCVKMRQFHELKLTIFSKAMVVQLVLAAPGKLLPLTIFLYPWTDPFSYAPFH